MSTAPANPSSLPSDADALYSSPARLRLRILALNMFLMEGSSLATSINRAMGAKYGLWNPGHLVWAAQRRAAPVNLGNRQWAGWATYEEGVLGAERQILLDAKRGLTFQQFVYKYAPPAENDSGVYLSVICSGIGVQPDWSVSRWIIGQHQ